MKEDERHQMITGNAEEAMEMWRRKSLAPDLAAGTIEINESEEEGNDWRERTKAAALGRPVKDYSRLIVNSARA